jgi:CHAT domain-containing protein/Tfp pilus assembly protein PilF
MNLTKKACWVLCPILLAAALPLIHAQTNKDQPTPKANEKQTDGDTKRTVKTTKVTGELKRDDPADDKLKFPSKVHEFKMGEGQAVVIRLTSSDFDAFLIVRDSNKKELAFNDDDHDEPATLNSKLVFLAPKKDSYKIVVTSTDNKLGKYELTIEAATKDQVLDQNSATKATDLLAEADKLYQSDKKKECAKKISEALDIRRKLYSNDRYPDGHVDLAQSLNDLGTLLQEQGDNVNAERYWRDALDMRRALYPKNRCPKGHEDLAYSLHNLGFLFVAQGLYVKAEPFYRDALAMRQALYPEGHPELAASWNNLGYLLQSKGEYTEAEVCYRNALDMMRGLYAKDKNPKAHAGLALSLSNMGYLLLELGEYTKAEDYYVKALKIRQALYTENKSDFSLGHDLANSLNNMGFLLQTQQKYAEALDYYRQALEMKKALYPKADHPKGHPDLALGLSNMGYVLVAMAEYTKAEGYYHDALKMRQALYPKEHPDLAGSLNNMGFLHQSKGEYAEAENRYRDALVMRMALYPENRYPQGHPHIAASLSNLGILLQARERYAEAELYLRDALAMHQLQFDRLAEYAAEAEALNFAAPHQFMLDAYLSIQRHLPGNPGAYDLVWKSRAPLTRILERRHLDMYASKDPAVKDLALKLQSARQLLALLLLSPPEDAAGHNKRLEELTDAKEDLEKHLAKQLRLTLSTPGAQTSPQQLSKAIPEGAAFIDMVRYTDVSQDPKVPGEKGRIRTTRFVAFVLLRGKPAQRVDLGEAVLVEKAWAAWREAIVKNRPDHEAAAALAALVWQPLRPHLPAATHTVWLAPDGQLAQVPWAALPGAQPNTILLEELAVAVVPHGSFLLQRLQNKPAELNAAASLLAVGGVAYEQAPRTASRNEGLARAPGDKHITWPALPGTASEQATILDLARQALKTEPLVLQGSAASIAQVSAELPKVRFAHLATHGFFADPVFRSALQVDERQFQQFSSERKTAGARSPLVLSGLVLAGANRPETPERGIMTAETVVSLRLEDLELAVLSACETGLGETAGGEGVFGLQRAFHLAGARSVIASLWRVDDDATAALMGIFYRKLWLEGHSPLQALREAQLHIYRHPEQIKGLARRGIDFTAKELPKVAPTPVEMGAHAHTSQWAAFVLSGVGK